MASEGLTVRETAKALGVSIRTVHRYVGKGLLEARKLRGKLYISEDSLRHVGELKSVSSSQPMVDPTKYVTIDRHEWQGLMDRLSQLEAKETLLLESERAAKEREGKVKAQEHEFVRLQERTLWLEIELHNSTRPLWKKALGVGKRRGV